MARLIVSTQITLDGAMEPIAEWFALQGSHDFGGQDQLASATATLLGGPTFTGLKAYWEKESGPPYADRFNAMPKFVASRTLKDPVGWNGTVLQGELAGAVRHLKERAEGVIISYGCGVLAYELCKADLVDELRFWVHAWVLGDVTVSRPFKGRELPLEHIATRTYDSGVVCVSYRPRKNAPA
jgi:dihydrofolate reductase